MAAADADDATFPIDRVTAGATALLVIATLIVPIFGRDVYDLAERAALDLLDPSAYVEAVRNS